MKLITHTINGGVDDAVSWVNKFRLEHFFVQVATITDFGYCVVIFRVPDDFEMKSHMGKVLNPRQKK